MTGVTEITEQIKVTSMIVGIVNTKTYLANFIMIFTRDIDNGCTIAM